MSAGISRSIWRISNYYRILLRTFILGLIYSPSADSYFFIFEVEQSYNFCKIGTDHSCRPSTAKAAILGSADARPQSSTPTFNREDSVPQGSYFYRAMSSAPPDPPSSSLSSSDSSFSSESSDSESSSSSSERVNLPLIQPLLFHLGACL
jgi:hypothetical protein